MSAVYCVLNGIPNRPRLLLLLSQLLATAFIPAHALAEAKDGETFGDWAVKCGAPKQRLEPHCFIFQNVVVKHSGERLLHVAAGHLTIEEKPAAIVTLPLGISIPPGIGFAVDGGETVRLGLEGCEQTGCFGAVSLTEELLATLRAGSEVRVHFHDGNRQKITVPLSLRGFSEGFDSLR